MSGLASDEAAALVARSPELGGTAGGMLWTYVGLVASAAATVVLAGYSLRTFGAGVYGFFALAITVGRLAQIIPSAFITATTRIVARESRRSQGTPSAEARGEVAAAHTASLASAGVAIVVAALIAVALWASGIVHASEFFLLILVGASVALSMSTAVLQGVATGLRSFRLLAVATFFGSATQLIVVVVLSHALKAVALGFGELVAVAVSRLLVGVWLRRGPSWLALRTFNSRPSSLKTLLTFAGPLWVIGASTQVLSNTDVIILSALSTVPVVGLYRAGSIVPTQFVSALFRGYDTAFPVLAGEPTHRAQEEAVRLLTLVFSLIAGIGCGFLVFERDYVSQLIAAHPDQFVANVVALFSVIWLVNVPVHGLALLLIARGNQRRLVPLVGMEMGANLLLTIVLVRVVGPLGAAWASLITIVVSNALALPYIVRRELEISILNLVLRAGYVPAILAFGAAGLAYVVSVRARIAGTEPVNVAVLSLAFGALLAFLMIRSADRRLIRSALRAIQ